MQDPKVSLSVSNVRKSFKPVTLSIMGAIAAAAIASGAYYISKNTTTTRPAKTQEEITDSSRIFFDHQSLESRLEDMLSTAEFPNRLPLNILSKTWVGIYLNDTTRHDASSAVRLKDYTSSIALYAPTALDLTSHAQQMPLISSEDILQNQRDQLRQLSSQLNQGHFSVYLVSQVASAAPDAYLQSLKSAIDALRSYNDSVGQDEKIGGIVFLNAHAQDKKQDLKKEVELLSKVCDYANQHKIDVHLLARIYANEYSPPVARKGNKKTLDMQDLYLLNSYTCIR